MLFIIVFVIISLLMITTYIGYPLFLMLFSPRQKNDRAKEFPDHMSVCMIISAYNEEKVIEKKIKNSLDLDCSNLRIVVVSDGSTDDTVSICKRFLPQIDLIHIDEKQGKNEALNNALVQIHADIIVFSDANSFYRTDAISKLIQHYSNPQVGCVVGNLQLRKTDISDVGSGEGLYWRYEHQLKILESRYGNLLVANGSIFSARRELIDRLDVDVANDFQIPLIIAARGYKVLYEPEAVAFEKTASDRKEEFNRKVRIVNRGIHGALRLRKYLHGFLLFEFIFHKLLRWLSGVELILIFAISATLSNIHFFRVVLILQSVFYLLALLGYITGSRKKILYIPFYITLVNLAATIALIKVLHRKRYASWESPRTSR